MPLPVVPPEEALRRLVEGNNRYTIGLPLHLNQDSARRIEVAREQHPFAAILGCSDSRVPPEVVFDQGLGDLFVVRTGGNVVDDLVLGSLEYAIEHLGVRLIVVLGHQSCLAIKSAIQSASAPGHIDRLVKLIRPAVEKVLNKPGDLYENAIQSQIGIIVELLKDCQPILARLVKENKMQIVGAHYELITGKVKF